MDRMNKERKAEEIVSQKRVKKEIETDKRVHFSVQGDTENHLVIFDKAKNAWSCDCRYFSLQSKECSHIFAAKMLK